MLQINWSTLLLQILNFVVMAVILWRFFFRSVVRILDERSQRVSAALEEAERKEQEAEALRAGYEEQIATAQEQVITMQQQAQEEIVRSKRQVLDETRTEISTMRDKAAAEIKEAHQQALYQHRQALGRLATDLSARMIRDAATAGFFEASIERFADQLDALSEDQFRQSVPEDEGEEEAVRAQLVSARDLDAPTRARIENRVTQLVGRPVVFAYKTDPELVAGATLRLADIVIDGSVSGRLEQLQAAYVTELEQNQA